MTLLGAAECAVYVEEMGGREGHGGGCRMTTMTHAEPWGAPTALSADHIS